jgi:uncharacterized membrane protein
MDKKHTDVVSRAAPAEPAPAPRRRPFGLYAILVLMSVQALLGVTFFGLLGVGFAVAAADFWRALSPDLWSLVEPLIVMLAVAVVVVGLWRYRPWAWYGMMLLLAYWLASDLIAYFQDAASFVSMLLNVLMVFYLNQREVRDLFEAPAASEINA